MFHSARWKAYLYQIKKDAKNNDNNGKDSISSLFHQLHARESALYIPQESNGHQLAAEEHLRRSEELMRDCTEQVDALEETLANTPKPSEVLNWGGMTLGDLMGGSSE